MKKSLIFKNFSAIIIAVTGLFLTSCVKNARDGAVDFSQLAPIMQIPEGSLVPSKFSNAGLQFDGADLRDSVYFRVNYAATTVAPTDITVTLGIDAAALAAYNAANSAAPYLIFPANIYSFTTTTVTIKAGQNYSDPIKLVVFPFRVDPAINFMLPISITAASGVAISGNFGTIYYHFIGNKLAGTYNNVGTRYNYSTSIAGWNGGPIPACCYSTAVCGTPKVLAAVNSKIVTTYYANLGAGTDRDYYITYDDAVSLTDLWPVTFTPSFEAGVSNIVKPVHTYDPVLKRLHLVTSYNNQPGGAGSDRIVDETMTKQ